VPELREEIDALRRWWEPDVPGQHVVFGDLLTPFLASLLRAANDRKRLQEIFDFIEELAKNPDVRVQEVVA